MFGWCNTRTEQVTRSTVTPSGKYIWVNQLLVPNLTNNSKCVTSIMSHSPFKRDKIDEILTSVNVIFNVPRDIVQIAYHLRQKSLLHFATSHDTLQQSQLHTWQSQLHILCLKTHNFRPWLFDAKRNQLAIAKFLVSNGMKTRVSTCGTTAICETISGKSSNLAQLHVARCYAGYRTKISPVGTQLGVCTARLLRSEAHSPRFTS